MIRIQNKHIKAAKGEVKVSESWVATKHWVIRKTWLQKPELLSSETAGKASYSTLLIYETITDKYIQTVMGVPENRQPFVFTGWVWVDSERDVVVYESPSGQWLGLNRFYVKMVSSDIPSVVYAAGPECIAMEDETVKGSRWMIMPCELGRMPEWPK